MCDSPQRSMDPLLNNPTHSLPASLFRWLDSPQPRVPRSQKSLAKIEPPRSWKAARLLTRLAPIVFSLPLLCALAPLASADEPTAEQLQFFENKIRPVLVNQCYSCHSTAAEAEGKLRGELKLDSRAAVLAGGESGPAVVPGKPDEGTLIDALKHITYEMPPSGKLADNIIDDFVAWVEMGAPDPREGEAPTTRPMIDIAAGKKHWAFLPLDSGLLADAAPGIPDGWPTSYIDQWLGKAQRLRGAMPVEIAPARVLVRRAWFDVVGLPPTPEQMEYWVERIAPEGEDSGRIDFAAYTELVDTLLNHPGYGERWARHWLDIARFAESHGYEQDYDRPTAYHYRDFLIRAFNEDLPYDTFVKWQLAGDEYAPENPLAMMATGFIGGGAFPTQLTEAEFESARYDELDDIVGTTGVAFLGLSIACARCHDHKYDPIPASDYYQLASVFRTAIRSEIDLDLDPVGNAARRDAYATKEKELTERLTAIRSNAKEKFEAWLQTNSDPAAQASSWMTLSGSIQSTANTRYELQADGSLLAVTPAPNGERLTFQAPLVASSQAAVLRLETLADPSLPNGGPGRADNGNFALGDLKVAVQRGAETIAIPLREAKATHQQNDSSLSVAASLDADSVSGWAVDGQIGKDQAAVFTLAEPFTAQDGDQLIVTMVFEHPNSKHIAGRMRWSVSSNPQAPVEVGAAAISTEIVDAIRRYRETDGADQAAREIALAWFATTLPEFAQTNAELAALRAQGPGTQLTKVLVTTEGLPHLPHHADGRGFPHFYPEVYQLRRGDVHQKVGVVEAGYLQVLMNDECDSAHWNQNAPEGARTSYRRRALAEWMLDTKNGAGNLVARVMVNRLWQHHFGKGIVATPNDFGVVGAAPSHPELLDALASELVENGWSLKAMHRRIMTSAAYVRSSQTESRPESQRNDPENVTLWRREPRRLEAEAIRDNMLVVSGSLDDRMYGPGTLDQNMNRRSIYFFIKRSQLVPMMMLFDWPEHLVSIGQRSATTVAPQALMFMNSPQGRQFANKFASRFASLDDDETIDQAYRWAFGRAPHDNERELGLEFLRRQSQRHIEAGHTDAAQLARIDYCQTLMSLNEFVYID